jgi:4-amino-4-deoxy-L-arabinose transferase-like glycosyltransferase
MIHAMQQVPYAPPEASTTARPAPTGLLGRRSTALFWFLMALVALVAVFNVTWHMADQNVGDWDEGRHAVTAYEMLQRGDLLVNTYRGAVDYWNLKPPLSFWPLMLSFKVLGYSTFALRVPSALFFLATVACVAVYAYRTMGRRAALGAAAALATCYPVIGSHSGRTGDPDALFVLLMTVGLLAVLGAPGRPRLLLLWTLAFSAAFLTKSWHSGLLIVIGVVFLAIRGRASRARVRDYLIALLGFLPVLAWAIARFTFDGTRFFTAMVQYDLLSRSEGALETNTGGPLYYVERLAYLAPWALVLLVPIVSRAARRGLRGGSWRRSQWVGPAVSALLVLGAFSIAKTKLPWYAYPAFPALALLIGFAIAWVSQERVRSVALLTLVAAVVAALAAEAYVVRKIPAPTSGAQVALAGLRGRAAVTGEQIYLDPALASEADDANERERAKVGDWPQSLRTSALINGRLVPREGGVTAFEQQAKPGALILVEQGSPAAVAVRATTDVVDSGDGYAVLRAR